MTVLGLESATRFGTEGGVIRGLESWGAAGGGFSPTDIANLVGVWRADVAADFTLAGSNFTEWRPNLGSGTPFTVRSGTPIRDTTPAPEVVLGQSSMALHSPLALTQPFTVAYVLRLDNGWGNPVMEGPADETNVFRHGSNGNFTAECAGSEIGVVMDNTAFHVVTIVFNGASSVIRCDGTEVTGTLGTSNFGAYVYFGSATGGVANGNQEHRGFVAYGKALTLTEREDLEVWLTAELLPPLAASDDFNRANTMPPAGLASPHWTAISQHGASSVQLTISSNEALGQPFLCAALWDEEPTSNTDCFAEVDWWGGSGGSGETMGPIICHSGANTTEVGYSLHAVNWFHQLWLFRDGVQTVNWNATPAPNDAPPRWINIRLSRSGNVLTGWVDGVVVGTYTDSTPLTGTRLGFGCRGGDPVPRMDNWRGGDGDGT